MREVENDLVLLTPYVVTSADTDLKRRIRLGALVNLLIQSAIASAEKLGFGFSHLHQQQLFWVLRNLTVEVSRPLMWGEVLEVETWPKDVEGVLYLRDFIIRDAQGVVVVRATSGWLAIDLATKRPKRLQAQQMENFTRLRNRQALEYHPVKLAAFEGELPLVSTETPRFSDIDLNGHVTATRYIDWIVDTLPMDFLKSSYPTTFSINYLKETMPTDSVAVGCVSPSMSQFCFEGQNVTSKSKAFLARIDY